MRDEGCAVHFIAELRWREDRVEHIARHEVSPDEFEDALFGDPRGILKYAGRAESDPSNRMYRHLGRTGAGRYLFLVLMYHGDGGALPVTARDINDAERRRYSR